jgi:hypothetical protein
VSQLDEKTYLRLGSRIGNGIAFPTMGDLKHANLLAHSIMLNPQSHIDALVEAGVLKSIQVEGENLGYHASASAARSLHRVYEVVAVHIHEWRVAMDVDRVNVNVHVGTTVRLICHECHETTDVPNRLPIEVPE